MVISVLQHPGFMVNYKKSSLHPTQEKLFLRALFITQLGRVFLSSPRRESILKSICHLMGVYNAHSYSKDVPMQAQKRKKAEEKNPTRKERKKQQEFAHSAKYFRNGEIIEKPIKKKSNQHHPVEIIISIWSKIL
ncbi:uncharacterized protein LOC144822453 isoform X2 [Lissotriton helveticus]